MSLNLDALIRIVGAASVLLALSVGGAIAAAPTKAVSAASTGQSSGAVIQQASPDDVAAAQHCDQDTAESDIDDDDSTKAPAQAQDGKDDSDSQQAANSHDDGAGDSSAQSSSDTEGSVSGCANAGDKSDGQDKDDDNAGDDNTPPPAPSETSGVDYYHDSEGNSVQSDRTVQRAFLDDYLLVYRKDTVQARDADGYQLLSATSFSIHRDITDSLGVSGGFGAVRSLAWSDPVGSLESEAQVLGASITARISHDMLSTTAQEIRANIRQTDFSVDLSDDLNKQVSVDVQLHHTMYSDGNRSDDVEFAPQYTIDLRNSKLSLGYHFQYSAFAGNPNNGYWAPRELLSHEATLKWAYDWSALFGSVELAGGHQTVGQFGGTTSSLVSSYGGASGLDASITGIAGIRLTNASSIQYYVNRDSSVGFSSTATGMMFTYTF